MGAALGAVGPVIGGVAERGVSGARCKAPRPRGLDWAISSSADEPARAGRAENGRIRGVWGPRDAGDRDLAGGGRGLRGEGARAAAPRGASRSAGGGSCSDGRLP